MHKVILRLGAAVVAALLSLTTLAPVGQAGPAATVNYGSNVRSGPGLDHTVVGGLAAGTTVQTLGASQNGWTPISFGGQKRYIYSQLISAGSPSTPAVNTTTYQTTVYLNARTGPGLNHAVRSVLKPNTLVKATSNKKNGYVQLSSKLWVAQQYLTSPKAPKKPKTLTASAMKTIVNLNMRTGPGLSSTVIRVLPKGTTVRLTGRESGSWAEIDDKGAPRWVWKAYLADSSAPTQKPSPAPDTDQPSTPKPSTPTVAGERWTTATLNIRTTPSTSNPPVGFLPQGTKVAITATTKGEWQEILVGKQTRWVHSNWLTAQEPTSLYSGGGSVGLENLTDYSKAVVRAMRANVPEIVTIYGVRNAGPGSDHTEGRAVDFMISRWSTPEGKAVGDAGAAYLQAHAKELNIYYLIWQQKIWLSQYPERGWQLMGDRGSYTQNHYDHIHVSVFPQK